jgi:hypothetical protein
MDATTVGFKRSAGRDPADIARTSIGAYRLKKASAIWLLPELCVHTKRTVFDLSIPLPEIHLSIDSSITAEF